MTKSTDNETLVLSSDEQHMISRVLNEGGSARLMFELAYLFPAGVLVALGVWHGSSAAFVSAFAVVLVLRLWIVMSELRFEPILRSAVRKLHARASSAEGGTRPPG